MRNPQGYSIITGPAPGAGEMDTFTCGHCNRVKFVKSMERAEDMGGLCKVCMRLICENCLGFSCDPIEEKLKRWEAKEQFLKSVF